jgi:hypothetical protein
MLFIAGTGRDLSLQHPVSKDLSCRCWCFHQQHFITIQAINVISFYLGFAKELPAGDNTSGDNEYLDNSMFYCCMAYMP